jgi:hypothetical protein
LYIDDGSIQIEHADLDGSSQIICLRHQRSSAALWMPGTNDWGESKSSEDISSLAG